MVRAAERNALLPRTLSHARRRGHARGDGGSSAHQAVLGCAQRSIASTSGAPLLASTPQQPHVAFSLTRICARLFVWGGRRQVGVSEFCERIVSRGGEKAGSRRGGRGEQRWGGDQVGDGHRTLGPWKWGRSVGGRWCWGERRCREKARLVDGLDEGAARAAAGIAERRAGALVDAVLGRDAGTTLPGERAKGAQSAW